MFDLFNDEPNYMGAAVSDSLSLSGKQKDPTEDYDLKTGKKKTGSLGEQVIAKDLAANNEAGILAKGSSIDQVVDQELEDQEWDETKSDIAKGLGILAHTAATAGMVADSMERNNPNPGQSRVRASAQRGGSGSNLLRGGLERYLSPIGGRGKKIQGYFR